VRVESRQRPDVLRGSPPFGSKGKGLHRSGYYANYNANKHALGLNLAHAKAPALVKRLARWADLVTENFTPGTMERRGLGYDDLRAVKPDIIMFSTSMLGRGGPYASLPGFGAVLSSLSGMTDITGWPDRAPTNPYGAYTDFITPRFAAAAILAALDYRRRTGLGQHLDMSQLEVSLHFIAPALLDCALNGREGARTGNRDPAAAPHAAFPCRGEDRWITIACLNDAQWQALQRVMGEPAWAQGERFATLSGRKAHEDELEALVAAWTQDLDAQELMQALQAAAIPAGVVQSNQGVIEDPQLEHRGHFVYYEHPQLGRHPVQRSEFRLPRARAERNWPAPVIGAHTGEVCRDILEMSEEEVAALVAEGVLEVPAAGEEDTG
jgi:benzylsuccinate CoA-transferase BbsF subunit